MWATDKKASAIFSQHLIIKLFANVFKEIINFRNNCYVQTCGASPHLGVLHALTHLHTNSLPIIYRIRSNIIEIVHSKSYCDFKRNPYLIVADFDRWKTEHHPFSRFFVSMFIVSTKELPYTTQLSFIGKYVRIKYRPFVF